MFCFNAIIVFAALSCIAANPSYNVTQFESSCTISSYSQVSSVVNNCTSITVQGLFVPVGKTLELDLKDGTQLTFKGTTTFGSGMAWKGPLITIKGKKINVVGEPGSILDGQGAKYWDGNGTSGSRKPKFFKIQATGGSTFSNINLLNCPVQCVSIQKSNKLTLNKWNIDVSAGDKNGLGHNTDGFDISGSDTVTIKNTVVQNQDDCIAVNSGKNLVFSNLECSGGHGLSLSIGVSTFDSSKNQASNIVFKDCIVKNSRNGIHVKTHCDAANGTVTGVTYSNIQLSGITHYAVNVQQDYKNGKSTKNPTSNIPIHGLTLTNVKGSMTGPKSVPVYVICGSKGCFNFKWSGVLISGGAKNSSCNYKPSGFNC